MYSETKFDVDALKLSLDAKGFLVLSDVLKESEVQIYRDLYEDFLSGKINAVNHRHDLGSHEDKKTRGVENITQVMWPSLYLDKATRPFTRENSPLHLKAEQLAKSVLGSDMEFDFDMLISKEPHTNTETPWHSDESYWLDLPDKRALSFWFPMQDVSVENGCMWFVPGSHKQPMRKHRPTKPGQHVLMTDECSNDEGVPQPLKSGGCTVHTGRTLHYTAGNTTGKPRRAYIVNFRPKAMIEFERKHDFDHGQKSMDDCKQKGQIHNK